jgi:ABC-type xylose transport system permease subunit
MSTKTASYLYLIVGILLVIIGVVAGLYVGVWWAFIGGIVDVINVIRSPEVSSLALAAGILKVVLATFIGWVSFAFFFLLGKAFIDAS